MSDRPRLNWPPGLITGNIGSVSIDCVSDGSGTFLGWSPCAGSGDHSRSVPEPPEKKRLNRFQFRDFRVGRVPFASILRVWGYPWVHFVEGPGAFPSLWGALGEAPHAPGAA